MVPLLPCQLIHIGMAIVLIECQAYDANQNWHVDIYAVFLVYQSINALKINLTNFEKASKLLSLIILIIGKHSNV